MESPTSLGVNKRLNNGGVNMTFINEKKERVEIVVRTMLDYHGNCTYRIEDIVPKAKAYQHSGSSKRSVRISEVES